MQTNVIAISRALGAGGEEIGRALAAELGYRYVDSEIIDLAAERVGTTAAEVASVEQRQGVLARIIDNLARASIAAPDVTGVASGYIEMLGPDYPEVIAGVIREVAAAGDCVLVAHGASHALGPADGVLRVLVTGSADARARRLNRDAHGPKRARQEIADSDAARADFLKRFYNVDHEAAEAYDLVVNTDRVSIDAAVRMVMAVAQRQPAPVLP